MKRLARSITVLVSALGTPLPAWAQDRPWEGWGMHPMWGVWGLWGIGMMVVMFVFWALVITGIVLGIRWLVSPPREPRSDRALAVLRERYALGEISKEEFEAKRRDLEAA